jgi:hypothetical protein
MLNFVAFRLTDNDFHGPLRAAVEYVANHRDEELSVEAWKEFVIRATTAFSNLSRISDWGLKNHTYVGREYFDKWLTVKEVKTIDELGDDFEGYVFDKNTLDVFYQGY